MSAALLASEFPEDPLMVLRAGWYFLVVYYVAAVVIVFFVWRPLKAPRLAHSRKDRLTTAVILALIFAPSEVSDFFLFNLPGPAAAGLSILLVAMIFGIISNPSAILTATFWGGLAKMLGAYYLLPLLVVFGIAYAGLWVYSRFYQRSVGMA